MANVRRNILKDWDILVLDDEPDSLDLAKRILKYYGATVHTGINGKEGLAIAREIMPQFIISDLSMPVMDGWDMLKALKSDRATLGIPVIALTAHAMTGDRDRAIVAGFHNYLTKPLTPATFINDLLRLLIDIPEFVDALSTMID